jgi:hypothetical protein
LSKAWLETWYTFPILYFFDYTTTESIQPTEDIAGKRNIVRLCDFLKRKMLILFFIICKSTFHILPFWIQKS